MTEYICSCKELAARLGRTPRYVTDLKRGGLKLPCRLEQAVRFIHRNPHPTRFRKKHVGH